MLSRVAHSLYWMARYVERAENIARFIEVTLNLTMDRQKEQDAQWLPLVQTTGDQEIFEQHYDNYSERNVLRFLTFQKDYPNSILSCLGFARENARTVREVISNEMWEHLHNLYSLVKSPHALEEDPYAFYEAIKRESISFAGLCGATMSRGEGWHWMRLGMMLERADKTSRILDVKYFMLLPNAGDVGTNYDLVQWRALLQSASALQMYRQQYHRVNPATVAEYLLLDKRFPRAVAYCLSRAESSLRIITGSRASGTICLAEKHLGRICANLSFGDIDEIVGTGLHEFIDQQQQELNNIDRMLFEQFFELPAEAS